MGQRYMRRKSLRDAGKDVLANGGVCRGHLYTPGSPEPGLSATIEEVEGIDGITCSLPHQGATPSTPANWPITQGAEKAWHAGADEKDAAVAAKAGHKTGPQHSW